MEFEILHNQPPLCYYIAAYSRRPEVMAVDAAEKRLEREVAAINRLREQGKEWGGKYPRIESIT